MFVALAGLVVSIIGLMQPPTVAAPVIGTSAPPSQTPAADPTAANHALCNAIAPLMTESDGISKAYSNLGPAGSPTYRAGISTFVSDTKNWVGHIQPVIDGHNGADPFLRRSLQRFVDDRRHLVADLEEGPPQPYDQTDWNDSLSAYNGPLTVCWNLGVKW